MADEGQSPQERIAESIEDISEQTRELVRSEVAAAQQELVDRLRQSAPLLLRFAGAGALGLLALASGYRFSLRVLERALSPGLGSLVAVVAYGGAAAVLARQAWGGRDALTTLLPVDTARAAAADVRSASSPSN